MGQNDQPVTVLDFLRVSAPFLESKGIENPRLNAEWLLAHVLKTDRLSLYLRFDYPLSPAETDRFRELLRRRAKREPVQYLTGEVPFLNLTIHVEPGVLIPRPETEELADRIIRFHRNFPPAQVLDIGTGSGILAISLASAFPDSTITAVDRSPDALRIARQNAGLAGVDSRIRFLEQDFLTTPIPGTFDLIVSNPPYIPSEECNTLEPEVSQWEPRLALDGGPDGLVFYRKISECLPALLNKPGQLWLEGHRDLMDAVSSCFADQLSESEIISDLSGFPRFFRGAW